MIILRDSTVIPKPCKGAVLALGNFDGLHQGHLAILNKAIAIAKDTSRNVGVLTFEPHPRRVFRPELPPLKIFPFREKANLLAEHGMDFMRVMRFTRAFSQTTARQFVTEILHQQLQTSHIVTGEDFIFGRNREGNAANLRELAATLGMNAYACAQVQLEGERCSSTRLRALLAEGDMASAERLLGRPYSITGMVRQGDKRGRKIGFPTANILPPPIFLPASGVYAVHTMIADKRVNGVANLGRCPTFNGTQMRLEVHLLDWQGDIYGQKLEVVFVQRIRNEQKFSDVEHLKIQIIKDCESARRIADYTKAAN